MSFLSHFLLKLRLSRLGVIINQSLKSRLPWLWVRLRAQALMAGKTVKPFVRGHSTGATDYPADRTEWTKAFLRNLK